MTLTPNRMTGTIAAIAARVARINTHAPRALANLHDAQPGIPAASDGRRGSGHSDPTANLALGHDPARDTLDEIATLIATLDASTARLDHLVTNWAGPSDKWRQALATEAALATGGDHNLCAAHQQAGLLEPARTPGSRLCQRCQLDRGEIGADPPVWMIEKRHRGRSITTIDMAKAKREAKATRKRKR